jgi:two-component system NtrC family sensor kinase
VIRTDIAGRLPAVASFGRLWAVAVLLPLLALAAAGTWTWNNVIDATRGEMVRSIDMVHEQVLRGLETQEAVLAAIDAFLAPMTWDEIHGSVPAFQFMRRITAATPTVETLGVADPAGFIAASSETAIPPRINLMFRDYVKAWPAGSKPGRTYFSAVTFSRTDGRRHVYASRPHLGPDGRGDGGVLVATFAPGNFEAAFAQIVQTRRTGLTLVLDDASLLARFPEPVAREGERLAPDDLAMQALRRDSPGQIAFFTRGWLLGDGELIAARPVANYNMHIIYRLDPAVVTAQFYRQMLSPSLAAAAAMALLLALIARTQARTLAEQAHLRQRMASAEADAAAATERAAFEARMRQTENIVALGQISAGIAHDFNNLLQVIALHSEQAQAAPTLDAARRAVAVIRAASDRGIRLTRRLLDMTRREPERAGGIASQASQAVAPVFDNVAALLSGGALGAGIVLRIAPVPDGLPKLRVAAPELEAVLINLMVNARDAMPKGGTITVNATATDAPPRLAGGRYVRIDVRDTGIGMKPETLARAGEAFFTTKPSGQGTGLGLSMARGFARDAGGLLEIDSHEGAGTVVTIFLPAVG